MTDVPSELSHEERTAQTNIRRWISSIDQTRCLFGHHREAGAEPEEPPKQLPDAASDEDLDVDLSDLEKERDDE